MGTRKSAADLTPDEIDRFVAAVDAVRASGVYDQFTALHGAVMRVRVRFASGNVQMTNMAHWNIGFCAWHRQYLLAFEQALQQVDAAVDLPYWDWSDPTASTTTLFSNRLVGSLGPATGPAPVIDDRFAPHQIPAELEEDWGTTLARGGGLAGTWPPSAAAVNWLENLQFRANDTHPLWVFWRVLEAGWPGAMTATHNAAHNFVGGHMAGAFSPNDPVFWLHHANVDRIWANWQTNYLTGGRVYGDDWPDPGEASPLDGRTAPYGHRIDDLMWPWVGQFAGAFESLSVSPEQAALIAPLVGSELVRVRQVLDLEALDYDYAEPGST